MPAAPHASHKIDLSSDQDSQLVKLGVINAILTNFATLLALGGFAIAHFLTVIFAFAAIFCLMSDQVKQHYDTVAQKNHQPRPLRTKTKGIQRR